MNDLKFRVWNGCEMVYDVMVGKFGVFYVNPYNNGIDEKDSSCLTTFNTKYPYDIHVMQFIGRHDINGKEIWEGDILKAKDSDVRGMIIYVKSSASFEVKHCGGQIEFNTLPPICNEVIGNFYENPELIDKRFLNQKETK